MQTVTTVDMEMRRASASVRNAYEAIEPSARHLILDEEIKRDDVEKLAHLARITEFSLLNSNLMMPANRLLIFSCATFRMKEQKS